MLIGLLQAIGAVHQALGVDAMRYRKHMPDFVGGSLDDPAQEKLVVRSRQRPVVESGKGRNAHSFLQIRLAEYVIPLLSRVKVFGSDGHEYNAIGGYPLH